MEQIKQLVKRTADKQLKRTMEEQIVSFETAKMLKEIGFNIEVATYFSHPTEYKPELGGPEIDDDKIMLCNYNEMDDFPWHFYSAPTQALTQKWFREVHKLYVVHLIHPAGIYVEIYDKKARLLNTYGKDGGYETWEKALEVGLQEACKIIKKRNDKRTNTG